MKTKLFGTIIFSLACFLAHQTLAQSFSVLVSFSGTNGANPSASLVQMANGLLFGTTANGGAFGYGSTFQVTTNGALTDIGTFNLDGTLPDLPDASLLPVDNATFYTTTVNGGPTNTYSNGPGLLLKITTNGTITTLRTFGLTGSHPHCVPVKGLDNNYYGTTKTGNANSDGIVYQYTTGGTFNILYEFGTNGYAGYNDGLINPLLAGGDGKLYGTAAGSGSNNLGWVFSITTNGLFNKLAVFNNTNGANPLAPLIQIPNGTFYGTTANGGTSNLGTIFAMTSGVITNLASFAGTNGANPQAALLLANDGNFYGTTYNGGTSNLGTIYEMAPNGMVSSLFSFTGTNGANPNAGLIQGQDGRLYGTTYYGGASNVGVVFALTLPPAVITSQPLSQTNLAGTNVILSVAVSGIGPFTYQWQFNGTNVGNNLITTVVGNGTNIFAGDGGAATNAGLNPWDLAFDVSGNLYAVDRNDNRIRKIDTNGIISTVAGKSTSGFSGDGAAATNATFNNPIGVVFDTMGNYYIADRFNNRIRRISTNGVISTVAGSSSSTYSGDGGVATSAGLGSISVFGEARDYLGNLYISETASNTVRKVNTNGIITTVAGNFTANFFGDGGAATNAAFNGIGGASCDASGNLYIADGNNHRVRKMDANGIITTVAGSGTNGYSGDGGMATNADLNTPWFMAFDGIGNLYISDRFNEDVRKVDTNGIITTVAGNGGLSYAGDGGAATNASFHPAGLAFDAAGNLYIADDSFNVIRKVAFAGAPTFTINQAAVTNAGNYTVIVTGPYGSVTSAVATLTVTVPRTPPQIVTGGSSLVFVANQFGFNISGAFGQIIVVDGSTNLVDWAPLYTNTVGNGLINFADPVSSNFPARYYKVILP